MTSPPPGPLYEATPSRPIEQAAEPDKPWDNRYLLDPKRTWCGRVVHKRHHHLFTVKDLERISKAVTIYPNNREDRSWLEILLRQVFRLIFLIVPVPGWLQPFEAPFIDWYVGVVDDGFQPGTSDDYRIRVKDRTDLLIRRCADIIGGLVIATIQEE